jgi:hypothetical protein
MLLNRRPIEEIDLRERSDSVPIIALICLLVPNLLGTEDLLMLALYS